MKKGILIKRCESSVSAWIRMGSKVKCFSLEAAKFAAALAAMDVKVLFGVYSAILRTLAANMSYMLHQMENQKD